MSFSAIVSLEQRDRVPVPLELGLIVALVEVLAVLGLQIIQHFLMLGIERRRQLGLHLAAIDQGLQFVRRLLMVLDHLFCERLGVGIGLTLAHFSVSSAMNLLKPAGDNANTVPPTSRS